MDAEREVEGGLALEPINMRAGLVGADFKKVAIKIQAGRVFARAADESGGI